MIDGIKRDRAVLRATVLAALIHALLPATALPAEEPGPNTLSPDEAAQGFELLFDGSFESFHDHFVDYQRNDSVSDRLGYKTFSTIDPATGSERIDSSDSWWRADPD